MPWINFSLWWLGSCRLSHMFQTPVTVLTANRPVMALPTAMCAPFAVLVLAFGSL